MRGTWLWLRDQGLKFLLQSAPYIRGSEIIWTEPTYHAVHNAPTPSLCRRIYLRPLSAVTMSAASRRRSPRPVLAGDVQVAVTKELG